MCNFPRKKIITVGGGGEFPKAPEAELVGHFSRGDEKNFLNKIQLKVELKSIRNFMIMILEKYISTLHISAHLRCLYCIWDLICSARKSVWTRGEIKKNGIKSEKKKKTSGKISLGVLRQKHVYRVQTVSQLFYNPPKTPLLPFLYPLPRFLKPFYPSHSFLFLFFFFFFYVEQCLTGAARKAFALGTAAEFTEAEYNFSMEDKKKT